MQTFSREPTGTSLRRRSESSSLPFPAVSVCDSHYDYGRAYDNLDFPRIVNVLTGEKEEPEPQRTHPLLVYKYLDLRKIDLGVTDFLWEYYHRLDLMIDHDSSQVDEYKKYFKLLR